MHQRIQLGQGGGAGQKKATARASYTISGSRSLEPGRRGAWRGGGIPLTIPQRTSSGSLHRASGHLSEFRARQRLPKAGLIIISCPQTGLTLGH